MAAKRITKRLSGSKRQSSRRLARATTIHARYVFLDIEGFTLNRSVEAQADLVRSLNRIVRAALSGLRIKEKILLPTGDGMCIAIISPSDIDVHVRLALKILALLKTYNEGQEDQTRRFALRIGVNENDDNLVVDINGERNLAGAGINMAQRVMSAADGNQVLLGQPVFEILRHRESYMEALRSFSARAKHGVIIAVHQLVLNSPGLDTQVPAQFQAPPQKEERLTKFAAYYLANALKLRTFLTGLDRHGAAGYASKVLLWFLAEDSEGRSNASETSPYTRKIWRSGKVPFREQFEYYKSLDFWVITDLSYRFTEELSGYAACFENQPVFDRQFVTEVGRKKLKSEFPEIWEEFGLDEAQAHA